MKILFSPSEAKFKGGELVSIVKENYIFPELFSKRLEMVKLYNEYVLSASNDELIALFGTKKQEVIEHYKTDIFKAPTKKVIERYDGVAYDYLNYGTLSKKEQTYIDKSVIIFSNLFGAVYAGDKGLPDYKLKQGQKIGEVSCEKFYKKHFSDVLEGLLQKEEYLDLRAGFYTKFYKPTSPYTTLKFLKEGKVVSHWAKAYRGVVLRSVAQNNIKTIDAFMIMKIENLEVKEVILKGFHREIIYDIKEK